LSVGCWGCSFFRPNMIDLIIMMAVSINRKRKIVLEHSQTVNGVEKVVRDREGWKN